MKKKEKVVRPLGKRGRLVREDGGPPEEVPKGWELLAPGDAALTRRVKAAGDYWAVKVRKGGRELSRGIWAPSKHIATARRGVEAMRADPSYEKKLAAGRARRAKDQQAYVREFTRHVRHFLSFHARHSDLEARMATAIATHATPVGSGTVARTSRIPVAERAEAAVIAWMRHQTTAYDRMSIPRVKGQRRQVRRRLAARSRELLATYRSDEAIDGECPLSAALRSADKSPAQPAAKSEVLAATPSKRTRVAPRPSRSPAKATAPQSTEDVLAERERRQAALRAKFKRR